MEHVPDKLISAYLEGTLDEGQAAELSGWVQASPEHARYLASLTALEHGLAKHARVQSNSDILTELQQIEEQGEDLDPMVLAAQRFPTSSDNAPSKGQYLSALFYVMEHTFTPKRVAIIATAAMLLLGVALTIVFLPGDDGSSEVAQVSDSPEYTPVTPTPDPNRVVATITAQSQAVWFSANGEGKLPDRTLLGPNQRLTLAKGFAEITTMRGAVVLVQSPATIETTDRDNAIRLHRGKLVGRCETPRSKGFIVHAPGMDVVDLGTEFGVEADAVNGTTVLVMEGSVRAQPTETSPRAFEPVVLEANQARRVEPASGRLEMIAKSEAPVFHAEVPHPYVAVVLDADPLAYWRFEDQSVSAVSNEVNPGRDDLLIRGSAAIDRDGLLGMAGRFDSSVEPFGYFTMGDTLDSVSDADVFTFECWFHVEKSLQGTLLSLYEPDPNEIKHIINVELQPSSDFKTADQLGWQPQSIRVVHCSPPSIAGSDGTNLYSGVSYRLNQWHHVVVVKEPRKLKVFLDGRQVGEKQTDPDIASNAVLSLGLTHKDGSRFPLLEQARPMNGWIDEVAMYDRALSAEEIGSHWNAANALESQP